MCQPGAGKSPPPPYSSSELSWAAGTSSSTFAGLVPPRPWPPRKVNDGIDYDESECDELGVDRPLAAREPERDVRFERDRDPLRSPESGRVDA